MGNYNEHAPYILGNEWVPIRAADFEPDDAETEYGYRFYIDHTTAVVSGAYSVSVPPTSPQSTVAELVAVYPAGLEDKTGPIKTVTIPVTAVTTTGTGISITVADLLNPSDNLYGTVTPDTGFQSATLFFDVNSYSQQLFGKRILDVRLKYVAYGTLEALGNVQTQLTRVVNADSAAYGAVLEGPLASGDQQFRYISFSEAHPFWTTSILSENQNRVYPWRFQELAFMTTTASIAEKMGVRFDFAYSSLDSINVLILTYAALEVTFCEETRVLYGGDYINVLETNVYPNVGRKLVQLRTTALALPTTISAGWYTVTQTHCQITYPYGNAKKPTFSGIRQLYELSSQQGLHINRSRTVDDTFTLEDSDVLPHVTLHTSSAMVTGSHAYGVHARAPVYGSITATQDIEDDPVGSARTYPFVRFYARRIGNTSSPLKLVDVATGTFTVSITVEEFDALDEIVDGWKEVNLEFDTPPSFSTAAGDVQWRWSAVGEAAGNQWQVLAASGISFTDGHTNGPATYLAPGGSNNVLTWMSPLVSGAGADTLADATLIFSTAQPVVTGFGVSVETQEISTVTPDCGPSGCIPTGIYYHHLTWSPPPGVSCDSFGRAEINGWGTSTTGQVWTPATNGSNFSVGNDASIIPSTASSDRLISMPIHSVDNDVLTAFTVSNLPSSGTLLAGVSPRYTDASNHYIARASISSTGAVTLMLNKRVAGVGSTLVSQTLSLAVTPGLYYRIRGQIVGSSFRARIWLDGTEEPEFWQAIVTDTSLTTGTGVAVFARTEEPVPLAIFSYDFFQAQPYQLVDGYYEIQRSENLRDFQTIVKTENLCIISFDDYEMRVGEESEYRIRLCNVLDFCGDWVSASSTLTSPGVDITGDGNSLLIFTSNEDPNVNLAYVMQWEDRPIETFVFPEADEVQLQRMFGKDFFTAFHPLERGGEQFTRTLLVNLAAIPVPSLANFTTLRDLGWAELNYVCVRDELGNKWLANIRIPESNVRLNRTVYLATIEVTEVTDTPTPIDPE